MSAPVVRRLHIKNYRSIGEDTVRISLPTSGPLVVIGENNAGKTNIAKAAELLLGERWAGNIQLDDHDFFGRDGDGIEVQIAANLEGVACPKCTGEITMIHWRYDLQSEEGPVKYIYKCESCTSFYMSNKVKDQIGCLVIGADRRLAYQLSYTSKYTFLARLMTHFHDAMKANATVESALQDLFVKIRAEFDKVEEFKAFQELLVATVERFGGNFRYALDIDFSAYDPSNYFRSLRVHPTLQDQVRNFDELGTGQEQVLALAFAYAYARAFGKHSGLLLVIDEPESHLHPLAQRWLAAQIRELCAEEGLQVVISTHSPLFIDLGHPENLLLVRKSSEDSPTTVKQLSLSQLDSEIKRLHGKTNGPDSIGPYYAASGTPEIMSGFFARCCVLVEGPTEALALPLLLKLVGLDTLREGVAVIPCHGLSAIARWVRLFSAYGLPTFSIFDSDSASPASQQSEAAARADLEAALGASGTSSPAQVVTLGKVYAVFDSDFESAMDTLIGEAWSDAYESSRALIGGGAALKPLRARHAASIIQSKDLTQEARKALEGIAHMCVKLGQHTHRLETVQTTAVHETS